MTKETTYQILESNKPIISGVKITAVKFAIPIRKIVTLFKKKPK